METILFVPCYDGHIRVFAPVIQRLSERNEQESMVVFLEQVHGAGLLEFLTANNLPFTRLCLSSYSAREGRGLSGRVQNAFNYARFLFYRRREVRRFFDRINPAFVVTATDGFQADGDFLYEAKRRGLPSVCLFSVMTSSSFAEESKKRARSSTINNIYHRVLLLSGLTGRNASAPSRGYATRVAVWSEKHKEALMERGGLAEKMVITGSPAHDVIYQRLHQPDGEIKTRIYQQLDIGREQQIILYTAQPVAVDRFCTFEQQRKLTELIIETCSQFSEYILIIKLHPRESIDQYDYLHNHPLADRFRLVSEKDADLYDLVYLSRALITQSSTTGLDAVLFDKDMAIIDILTPVKDPMSYIRSGAALGVYQEDGLLPALENILSDENVQRELKNHRQKFAVEYAGSFDGKSSRRVVELISEMMGRREKK